MSTLYRTDFVNPGVPPNEITVKQYVNGELVNEQIPDPYFALADQRAVAREARAKSWDARPYAQRKWKSDLNYAENIKRGQELESKVEQYKEMVDIYEGRGRKIVN